MLEKILAAITDLVTAIKELTATVKAGASVKSESPKTDTPAKDKTDTKEKPKSDDKKAAEAALKAIQERGMALIKAGKQDAVKTILKENGAATFTQLKPEAFAKVTEAFTKLESAEGGDAGATSESTPTVTIDDVKKLAGPLLVKDGDKAKFPKAVESVKALLKKFGAPKVSEVPADKLAAFAAELAEIKPDAAAGDDLV